jgi:hypothetical protein
MHEDMYAMSVVFCCASTTQKSSHMALNPVLFGDATLSHVTISLLLYRKGGQHSEKMDRRRVSGEEFIDKLPPVGQKSAP